MISTDIVEPTAVASPALFFAEDSFRRLCSVIGVTHPKRIQDYLTSFIEHRLYNVRILLRSVSRLESKQQVKEYLKQIPLRSVHAQDLSDLLFGAYADVEANFVRQGILRAADLSGDWCELLTSLDIEPAPEIAEQLLDATDVSLAALLARLRQHPELKKDILQDIIRDVGVFREAVHLIDILDSALTGITSDTTISIDDPSCETKDRSTQVSGADIAAMYLRSRNGDQVQLSELRRLSSTEPLAAALLAELYHTGIGTAKNLTEAQRLGSASVHWLLATYDQHTDECLLHAQFALGTFYYHGLGLPGDETKAFNLFKRSAGHGCVAAQHSLGMCYENGEGVRKDLGAALALYRAGAGNGYATAQHSLGVFYKEGIAVEKDIPAAMCLFRLAAEQGYAPALVNLADCYYDGTGEQETPVSIEIVRLYRLAAEQNYAAGQCCLGRCYDHGQGVDEDLDEAMRLYRLAADQGLADAQHYLAELLNDVFEQVRLYRLAAKQSHARAQCELGYRYDIGEGVEQDIVEAERLYRLAAEQGDANAQCNLGICYRDGVVVPKNLSEAVRLFRLAAEQGLANAQNCLGHCYYHGKGVEKNWTEAVRLYRLAAEQEDETGQYNLGCCYYEGDGVSKNLSEAVRLYRLSAEQGDSDAQYKLGECYEEGEGVEKNMDEALRLYSLAAEQGHADANLALNCLEEDISLAQDA